MPVKLRGRMKDGRPIVVEVEDKGDVVPGMRPDGSRFPAYITMFTLRLFSEVDKTAADKSGDIGSFRMQADEETLAHYGVDVGSLDEV